MSRILVVDDDPHIREVLRFALEKAGHQPAECADGLEAVRAFDRERPDLVVLDIGLPEMDGLEVCRRLRADSDVPILFLSSRDDEVDRVLGLEMGGDDYVVKPFSPRELVARVKRILCRGRARPVVAEEGSGEERRSVVVHGPLHLDLDRHSCTWAGTAVPLTVKEFGLLQSLCGMPGKVYTRDELVDRAYGAGHHITDRTIDSHIRRIRKKLRDAGGDPIETIYGLGYRLRETLSEAHVEPQTSAEARA